MDKEQGNKLIAEFMGMFYDRLGAYMKVWIDGEEPIFFHCEWHPEYKRENNKFLAWEFAPDINWCQLMPVVEKIYKDHQEGKHVGGTTLDIFYLPISASKEMVWQAVVQFIQWYNQKQ